MSVNYKLYKLQLYIPIQIWLVALSGLKILKM